MKAFIFDFDGVIVDSEKYWDRDALAFYQTIVPSFTREDDQNLKGRSLHDTHAILVADYGLTMSKVEYMAHIDRFAERVYRKETKLIPGIRELISRLQQQSIPIAIASSGERKWIKMILEREELDTCFQDIVMADDVGIGKPDPAVYVEAAKRLNCEPKNCVALEDSTNGIRSAIGANMYCIALKHDWGYKLDLSAAHVIVTAIDQITDDLLRTLAS